MKKIFISLLLLCSINHISNAQTIAAGQNHSLLLCPDSAVNVTGNNSTGQLGTGNFSNKSMPVFAIGMENIRAISSGFSHSLFLKNDSTVWACGQNGGGQLGDSSNISKSTAVQVAGLSEIIAIAGGGYHSLFLKSDGTVWASGLNNFGQFADTLITDTTIAIQVPGVSGITAIAAGAYHSLFLKNDSSVWGMGSNVYGQLGDSTNTNKSSIVQVFGLTGVTDIAAGHSHSLFLKNDGIVWATGWNSNGQLGDSSTVNKIIPVQVKGLDSINSISAGQFHSLFLKNDSTVWAVGSNTKGQLGDSTALAKTKPVRVKNLSGIIAIAGGENHSLFKKNGGTVWAVGFNGYGQLGIGTTNDTNMAVQVTNLCIPLEISVSLINNVNCYGGNDGSVSAITIGGNPPYSYLWTDSLSHCSLNNLPAGDYSVTVTDAAGKTESAFISVSEPQEISVVISSSPSTCDTCPDGSATVTVSGGLSPYTYSWSNGDSASAVINHLPGLYAVTITDANGCTTVTSTAIYQPYSEQCSDQVIYVIPAGADTGNAGTVSNPASLNYALSLAKSNSSILLATGNYPISNEIFMRSGITLEGGFDPSNNWRKTNQQATIITRDTNNIDQKPNRIVAIECSGISHFSIHDITINTDDANGQGVSTYGIHLSHCSDYVFSRLTINAGNAGDGLDGLPGDNGINGANGQMGQPGDEDGGCCTGGGAGGSGSYPGSNAGGNGGNGGARGTGGCPWGSSGAAPNGLSGQSGMGCPAGGAGGFPGQGLCGLPISLGCDQTPASIGGAGEDGINGENGMNGDTGIYSWEMYFTPENGMDGLNGENGPGGGGGGGGGSQGCLTTCFGNNNGAGPGGSGGGEGGQGGFSGTGGQGGGGSFGIYIYKNGDNSFVNDCIINPGLPGNGGLGGIGGIGANGGGGAASVQGCDIGTGGAGGSGGKGGNGGNGGNGRPGISIPIYQDTSGIQVLITNNLSPQEPIIFVENQGEIFSDVIFSTNAVGNIEWIFDSSSTIQYISGDSATVQFTQTGRHTITLVIDSVPYNFRDYVGIYTGNYLLSVNAGICEGDSIFLQGDYQDSAGIYYDTVFSSSGCDSLIITSLEINSNPILSLSSIPDSGNASGTATATATGGNSPNSYEWSTGDTTSQISNLNTQIYYVTVTDANGCSSTDSVFVDFYTGEFSHISNLTSHVSIIPNPNDGKFTIHLSGNNQNSNYELQIINTLGEIVLKSHINNPQAVTEINLAKSGSGMYLIRLISDYVILQEKIAVN